MADLIAWNVNRAVDQNGDPSPGALAYFYKRGTTTAATVYADSDMTVPHPSPLVADADGVFAPAYSTSSVKVLVTDAGGVALTGYPMDPAYLLPAGGTGADRIGFDPTSEIPVTNVQAAIERVQENIVAPLADLGIGVTWNAEVLADIDATNTASGFYRFSIATSGTFPTGVVASDDGIVGIFRETSANGFMFLLVQGETTIHRRSLVGGAWDTWTDGSTTDAAWAAGTDTGQATISPAQLAATIGPRGMAEPQALAGSSVIFSGIPVGASHVEVTLVGASLSSSGLISLRLGTSGGIVSTGYSAAASQNGNSGATGASSSSTDIPVLAQTSTSASITGTMVLNRVSGNIWAGSGFFVDSVAPRGGGGGGYVDIGGDISQIAIIAGAGSFDAGTAIISWR